MQRVNKLKSIAAAAALMAAFASSATAGSITVSGNDDYRAGLGGEFNVRAADAGGAALLASLTGYTISNGTTVGTANGTQMNAGFGGQIGFQTFCIEYNENIALGGSYAASISGGSIYGGVAGGIDPDGAGGLPSTDLISVGTAYLYSQFATGALAGYTYANGAARAASAVMLQQAIWYLEDEITLGAAQKTANIFLQSAITLFGDGTGVGVGGAKANNTIYSVKALNLGGSAPNQAQDQLIMVPDGGLTVTLLGLGLGGLALLRRKSA